MDAVGAKDIDVFVLKAHGQAEAALTDLGLPEKRAAACRAALAKGGDPRAAAGDAFASFGRAGLRASCTDAARLGLRSSCFDYACSSHLVEHFDTPGRHVAELARVLKPDGTAFFLTPNAPWDYENPFHLVLFRPEQLRSLLAQHFSDVWVGALDATARVKEDFANRRAKAAKVLGIADPLDLRHRVPRRWWIAVYSRALPLSYRLLAREDSGGGTGISADDYYVTEEAGDDTPVLFAIASRPKGRIGP